MENNQVNRVSLALMREAKKVSFQVTFPRANGKRGEKCTQARTHAGSC